MTKKPIELVGAIDVGSHNLQMSIVQVEPNGKLTQLEDLTQPTNIGRDTFTQGRIQLPTIHHTCEILRGFSNLLKEYHVTKYQAVATSGIREAENREYVLEQIRLKSNIGVKIINNAQERFFMYKALINKNELWDLVRHEGSALIMNIASGGVEIWIYEKGSLELTEYVKIGALRLHETLASLRSETIDFSQVMEEYIESNLFIIKSLIKKEEIKHFIGLGSEINTIYQLCRQPGEFFIRTEDLSALYAKVYQSVEDQIADTFHLTTNQSETLLPSVILLNSFLKQTKLTEVHVPLVTLRQGLLYEMIDQSLDLPSYQESLNDIVSSVWYIAKKYGVNKRHASQVEKLSLSIFDQTLRLHKLGQRERLYLQIAAILHGIGHHVNSNEHALYSYQLIRGQNIVGIANYEVNLIANIARYHDVGTPSYLDPNYQGLTIEEKITVSKLAAILKIAESLDISHGEKVEEITTTIVDQRLCFNVVTHQNFILEEWSFKQNVDFFEEVIGIQPFIRLKS